MFDLVPTGGVLKKVFKSAPGAVKLGKSINKMRSRLGNKTDALKAAARRKAGKAADHPFAIRVKSRVFPTRRVGKLPPNSSRAQMPQVEKERVAKTQDFLGEFCFVPGTLVDTERGFRVIESLKEGDLVWAKDEFTGEVALKPITQTFERVAPEALEFTFSNGETIETTLEHPFYVEHKGFTPAGLVAIGNSIVTRAGPSLEVTAVEKHSSPHTVYNFEVEVFHSYFVDNAALWVHNANYTKFPMRQDKGYDIAKELDFARSEGAKFISMGTGEFWKDLKAAVRSGKEIKWGVTEGGELRLVQSSFSGRGEISHGALMNGQDVIAARQARFVMRGERIYLSRITGHTGHYYDEAVENWDAIMDARGQAALKRFGIEMVP